MFVVRLVRWVAFTVLAVALAGCGAREPSSASKSATVRASVRSSAVISSAYGTNTGARVRKVAIELHPHCVDHSRQLDCEGRYTFALAYYFRDGKPNSLRCGGPQASEFQYVVAGDAHAGVTGPPDAMGVVCDDTTPGTIEAEGVLAMADLTKTNWSGGTPPPAAFQATMQLTIDEYAIHYEWRSRDGADCTGQIDTTKHVQTTQCHWT